MEKVGQDAHVRVKVKSYWKVGLRNHVGVEEVGLVHYDDHHHERVEVPSVFQPQVVDWPSQFHRASLQNHR